MVPGIDRNDALFEVFAYMCESSFKDLMVQARSLRFSLGLTQAVTPWWDRSGYAPQAESSLVTGLQESSEG